MLQLNNIIKSYQIGKRQLPILHGIDLHVEKGEMVGIMGPSGSGKSTLLNVVGLLDQPTSGSYLLEGKEVANLKGNDLAKVRAEKIGFIFQSFNLLPFLSALGNVELGQEYANRLNRETAKDALLRVGLENRMNHRPKEMSGGEQQRVAVARALAKDPSIVLADEPTGNLDSRSSKDIMSILQNLHEERGITLVMITHDIEVAHYCQRIIHIQDGEIVKEERP